jgi:exopolysaccharide biosynthesis polyprenyl glycosylphosphotransferase
MIRLFKIFVPTSIVTLFLTELVISVGSYVAALYLFLYPEYDPPYFLIYENGFWRILPVAFVIIMGLYFHDLYAEVRVRHRVELLQQLCLTIGAAFISQAFVTYISRGWSLPKWLMIYGSAIALILLFGLRVLFSATMGRVMGAQRVLFLGRSPIIFQVADHFFDHPESGFRPLGFLDELSDRCLSETKLPLLGTTADLDRVAGEQKPSQIVVGMSERRERMPAHDLLRLRFSGIPIVEIAALYEVAFGRVCARELRPSQLIFTPNLGPAAHTLHLQSVYSKLLALTALVVLLPVMILVAILVKLTSPGPVLFRQTRVGRNEKLFTLYKFRSMYQDAELRTGPVWATRNDPRITPLGVWLRKSRLDELPQLFNVLRGEMAIVGPRPERPEFVQTLSERVPYYRQRHSVMPGITGWAQINYKYGDTIEDTLMKLEYDLYYIKNVSVWLDFFIMFHTAKTMILVRGAQ